MGCTWKSLLWGGVSHNCCHFFVIICLIFGLWSVYGIFDFYRAPYWEPYGCTTWTLTKRRKNLDGNYTRMLRAILNKSWRQHPTTHQLYGHLPPITKTIQVRRTRHAGHCWRSRDELISDVLLWNPTYARAKAGRPARTYIQQLCEDTGCGPEDLPEAMNNREKWRERVRDIRASGTTWWWWWWYWEQLLLMNPFYRFPGFLYDLGSSRISPFCYGSWNWVCFEAWQWRDYQVCVFKRL